MAYIKKVTLPTGNTYDIGSFTSETIHSVKGTQTSNTASWTGVLPLNSLEAGTTISYFLPRTSAANATLNLTLADGTTTTGAKNVYFQGTTRMGTQYPAGSHILLTYYPAGTISINGTATTADGWWANNYTDNDTKVTSAANHYAPSEDSSSQLDADASSSTAATWGSTSMVTGVTIKRDAKGHVTGLGVDSIKMPANPNTDHTYTLVTGNTAGSLTLTGASGDSSANVVVKDWDQMATKTYVDNLVASAVHFKGSFNASNGKIDGGSSTLTSVAEKVGDMYVCDTAGTLYGTAFEIGDSLIFRNEVAAGTAPVAADVIPVEKTVSVTDGDPALSWGTRSKVGTVEGVDLHVTMPSNPNTDTKVTSSANHYSPSTASGSDKSASASGATAAWGIDVVKGVTLNTDGKGHVTGISVTSGKIPNQPTGTPDTYTVNSTTNVGTFKTQGTTALFTATPVNVVTSNPTLSAGTLPSLTTTNKEFVTDRGDFSAGTTPVTFSVSNETLQIANGTAPSMTNQTKSGTVKVVNTFSQGTLPSLTNGGTDTVSKIEASS